MPWDTPVSAGGWARSISGPSSAVPRRRPTRARSVASGTRRRTISGRGDLGVGLAVVVHADLYDGLPVACRVDPVAVPSAGGHLAVFEVEAAPLAEPPGLDRPRRSSRRFGWARSTVRRPDRLDLVDRRGIGTGSLAGQDAEAAVVAVVHGRRLVARRAGGGHRRTRAVFVDPISASISSATSTLRFRRTLPVAASSTSTTLASFAATTVVARLLGQPHRRAQLACGRRRHPRCARASSPSWTSSASSACPV